MKIGLIGLGRIGTYHAANLVALDDVDQLVVTDAVPAAVTSAVERFGATPADSVEALLDAVDVWCRLHRPTVSRRRVCSDG